MAYYLQVRRLQEGLPPGTMAGNKLWQSSQQVCFCLHALEPYSKAIWLNISGLECLFVMLSVKNVEPHRSEHHGLLTCITPIPIVRPQRCIHSWNRTPPLSLYNSFEVSSHQCFKSDAQKQRPKRVKGRAELARGNYEVAHVLSVGQDHVYDLYVAVYIWRGAPCHNT
jgi:hypothetical protein